MSNNYPTPTSNLGSIATGDLVSKFAKKFGDEAYQVADFLFAVDSIKKVASGKGTWGDAANIGITAASFLFPPEKLLLLGKPMLKAIAGQAEKTIASEAVSAAAKRAAQHTANHANEIAKIKSLPVGQQGKAYADYVKSLPNAKTEVPTQFDPLGGGLPNKEPFVPEGIPAEKPSLAVEKQQAADDFIASQSVKKRAEADAFSMEPRLSDLPPEQLPGKSVKQGEARGEFAKAINEDPKLKQVNEELPVDKFGNPPRPEGAEREIPVPNKITGETEWVPAWKSTPTRNIPEDLRTNSKVIDHAAWLRSEADKLIRKNMRKGIDKEMRSKNEEEIKILQERYTDIVKRATPEERGKIGSIVEEVERRDLIDNLAVSNKNLEFAKRKLNETRKLWQESDDPAFKKLLARQGKQLASRIESVEAKMKGK